MCCFLVIGIIFTSFYLIPYFFIYNKELEEQRTIYQFKQLHFYEDDVKKEDTVSDVAFYDRNSFNEKENIDESAQDAKELKNAMSEWKGDCILIIPDINLEKIVYTGEDREQHLENYELITADENMEYNNGGNYIICGHASRLYGHSLNRLKELKKGAKIQIYTKDKIEEYTVTKVTYEDMNNTSKYCNQTTGKTLTILSCAKYISEKSYIVIHAKID